MGVRAGNWSSLHKVGKEAALSATAHRLSAYFSGVRGVVRALQGQHTGPQKASSGRTGVVLHWEAPAASATQCSAHPHQRLRRMSF